MRMSLLEDNMSRLGLVLPPCPVPVAAYVPAVRDNDRVYVS